MIGFLGGSRSKDNGSDERQGLAVGAMQPAPSTLPPAMPPVHTLAPQQMPNADANPQPRRTTPPPLPRHLSELMAPPPPAKVPASAAPLSAARAATVAALENPGPPDAATTPTQTYQLVRTLYDAREAVSLELAAMAKGIMASLIIVQRAVMSAISTPAPQPIKKPPTASHKVAPPA